MCCSLQTHVIIISCICLLFTGFATGSYKYAIIYLTWSNGLFTAIGSCILIWIVFVITSQILSIVGSSKNNKCLLIPFIISLVLWLLIQIGFGIYIGVLLRHPDYSEILIMLSIGVGISTYFLVIVVKYYKELMARARLQPERVLQP